MLKLFNISKTFNHGTITEKRAIKNINLTLEDGDFVTIIGGNGAGKSTLLNLIAGVHFTDTGSIILDGMDLTGKHEYFRAKYLGRVFQDPMMGTAANMEIQENLAMAMRRGKRHGLAWHIQPAEKALYKEKLALLDLGLEDRMSAKAGLLSGGQRQAIALLMATMKAPELILLDEHTAALDPKTQKKIMLLSEEKVKEKNLTALMITHNLQDALTYGNRMLLLHQGEIVRDFSEEEKKKLSVTDLYKIMVDLDE